MIPVIDFPIDCTFNYIISGRLVSQEGFCHQHRCFGENVLIMVTEGTLHITTGGRKYDVTPGEYIILRRNVVHYGTKPTSGPLKYMWVHYNVPKSENLCGNLSAGNMADSTASFRLPEYGRIGGGTRAATIFNQAMDLGLDNTTLSLKMADNAVTMLLMELSEGQNPQKSEDKLPATVESVAEWIRNNYYMDFSVKMIAETFGYQADYLSSMFKKNMHVSIVEYTTEYRLKMAKNLMSQYDLSIREIAWSSGFSDEKYFMKVFKKYEGITPSQYRAAFAKEHINTTNR